MDMADYLQKLARYSQATVSDALDGQYVLHSSIKPLAHGMRCIGRAFTVKIEPGNIDAVLAAAEKADAGDVLVIAQGGLGDYAAVDAILAKYVAKRALTGIVTDGCVRKSEAVLSSGLNVFCAGVSIRTCDYAALNGVATNIPVMCGGVCVDPGDIVYAGGDGVIVVPKDESDAVLNKLECFVQKAQVGCQ